MSYKYGLNGNDLNWDSMMMLNNFMEDFEVALHRGEIEIGEDGDIPEDVYESYSDSNPTMIYYKGDNINIQQLLREGKKLDDVLDWFIVHDTNGNFVDFVGDVPDEYLTEDYIQERDEAEGE